MTLSHTYDTFKRCRKTAVLQQRTHSPSIIVQSTWRLLAHQTQH